MKTLINAWQVLRALGKEEVWPLIVELLSALLYWVKHRHEPGAKERLFAAVMAVLVFVAATYFTPQTLGPMAREGGRRASQLLTARIPRWQYFEDLGQETVDVAKVEFFAGLDEDDTKRNPGRVKHA